MESGVFKQIKIAIAKIVMYNNINNMVINEGEIFLLKDLFKGYEWNRVPLKDRLLLGTLFLNFVNKTGGSIVAFEKTSSKQQKYKKTIKSEV